MSSEIHKYIETAIDKKSKLFKAEVLDFPINKENKENKVSKDLNIVNKDYWKINDDANKDQLKAVTGICFMIGVLFILGLLTNITSV